MDSTSFLHDLYGNIDNITLPMDRVFSSPPEVILIREHLRERTCKSKNDFLGVKYDKLLIVY